MAENENKYTAPDGRKIINVTNAGVSVTLESGEAAAKARKAEIEAEIAEMKLLALKRGVRIHRAHNPGPITR